MNELDRLTLRIDALEIHVAHQDQTIEDLSATIADQWKQIEDMVDRLTRLSEQVRAVENGAGIDEAPEPPPPHY